MLLQVAVVANHVGDVNVVARAAVRPVRGVDRPVRAVKKPAARRLSPRADICSSAVESKKMGSREPIFYGRVLFIPCLNQS